MENRVRYNSKTLIRAFESDYNELFSKSTVVASASGSFSWSGEHVVSYGAPAILQKLPVRTYVGLEPADKAGLFFSNIKYFVPSKQKFASTPFLETAARRINKIIEQEYKKHPKLKKCNGFHVHMLCENPPGCGLNTSGSLAASLSLALFALWNHINYEDVIKWDNKNIADLIKNGKFDKVFRLAWKIDSAIEASSSSGACAFIPLISSNYPILYFTERRRDNETNSPPVNIDGDNSAIDKIKYWAFNLEDSFMRSNPDWPIDFGLIYTGEQHLTQNVVKSINQKITDLSSNNLAVKEEFSNLIPDPLKESTDFLAETSEYKKAWWGHVMGAATEITLGMWWSLKKTFESGSSFSDLDRFFAFINAFQRYLFLIEASAFKADKISNLIRSFIRQSNDSLDAGTKLTGSGWGSDILFAVQKTALFRRMDEMLDLLKDNVGGEIYLDYSSWIDGIGNTGAKIEQNLETKYYSKFISPNTALIKMLSRSGTMSSKILSLKEYERIKNDKSTDIILDKTNSKIYIKGVKMNSKSLKSSFTTIEILKILMENIGKPVSSKVFPPSSYKEDRNEYTSKIVYPIKKVTKKYLRKELPLKVDGPISNFYTTLSPGLTILLREKII